MSVGPIKHVSLKNDEYYWLHAPAVPCGLSNDVCIGQYCGNNGGGAPGQWYVSGRFYEPGPGIIPISHIKKPTWKPK